MTFKILSKTVLVEEISFMEYYVDSVNGSDYNDGLTLDRAFKTLSKVNNIVFNKGDKLLLKCGSTFYNTLYLMGSGDKQSPVLIDSYGDGNLPKIVINPQKSWDGGIGEHCLLPSSSYGNLYNYKVNAGIVIKNFQYITVRNIEISGSSDHYNVSKELHSGVICIAEEFGYAIDGVVIENMNIHDIHNDLSNVGKWGAGILLITQVDLSKSLTDRKKSWFLNPIIRNNRIKNVGREGIRVTVNGWVRIPNSTGFDFGRPYFYYNAKDGGFGEWTPHQGVTIEGNILRKISGDGIVLESCSKSIIERNQVFEANYNNTFAAGIFSWNSIDILIQNNIVSDTKGGGDSQGIEIDALCARVFVQYNFIRNSSGGLFMYCGTSDMPIYESYFRFNIFENCRTLHGILDLRTSIYDCSIYNNTIYFSKNISMDADSISGIAVHDGEVSFNPENLNADIWYGSKSPICWINDTSNTLNDDMANKHIVGNSKIKFYNNVVYVEKGSLFGISRSRNGYRTFTVISPDNIDFCNSVLDYRSNLYVNMGSISTQMLNISKNTDKLFRFHEYNSDIGLDVNLAYAPGNGLDLNIISNAYRLIKNTDGTNIENINKASLDGSFSYNGDKNFNGNNINDTPPIGAM